MDTTMLACSQSAWMNVPEAMTLAQIAKAGFEAASIRANEGRSGKQIAEAYALHGLKVAPGRVSGAFWDPAKQAAIADEVSAVAQLHAEAGCAEMILAPDGGDYVTAMGNVRRQIPGRVGPYDSLSDDENARAGEWLTRTGQATLKEGVRLCISNRAGTPVETRAELERLLGSADPSAVFLCPNAGHLAWAGDDAVNACRDESWRIRAIILSDIDARVRQRGIVNHWDVDAFVRQGIYTELGEGCVDVAGILEILRAVEFKGWLIAENEAPRKPSAAESAAASRAFLRRVGV